MATSRVSHLTLVAMLASLVGCAHTQLRWNTTHQAKTLTDIYEQQVLDNLARFVVNPQSLPSFAYPNQGAADVSDSGNIGSDTVWGRLSFTSEALRLGGSRGMKEAWTLTPIYDVRRLELMHCAYQHALFNTGHCPDLTGCPDCDKIQRTFYLGSPSAKYNEKDSTRPDDLSTFTANTGRTTPACFQQVRWLAWGPRKCMPKDCRCLKSGHYCGTYVWLLPGGQDELTKLTLTVLDYAFSSQAVLVAKGKATKDVVWYFDKNGQPTVPENASQEIRATVPFDAPVRLGQEGVQLPADDSTGFAAAMEQRLQEIDNVFQQEQAVEYVLPPILPQPNYFSPLQYELNREFLTPETLPAPQ